MTDWRPDLVKMVLDKLVPDNVYVTVIAQKFAEVATQVRTYIFMRLGLIDYADNPKISPIYVVRESLDFRVRHAQGLMRESG